MGVYGAYSSFTLYLASGSLSTGSSGGGVWGVELDADTGLLPTDTRARCGLSFPYCWAAGDTAFHVLANNPQHGGTYNGTNSIEASYLYQHAAAAADASGGRYFLFVNYYWCCRSTDSTYELRVGRARAPTGPFVDRAGIDLRHGGGTLLVPNISAWGAHRMVGPGHAGVLDDGDGGYAFTFDFQGIEGVSGDFKTQARQLTWDTAGWPVVEKANFLPMHT